MVPMSYPLLTHYERLAEIILHTLNKLPKPLVEIEVVACRSRKMELILESRTLSKLEVLIKIMKQRFQSWKANLILLKVVNLALQGHKAVSQTEKN